MIKILLVFVLSAALAHASCFKCDLQEAGINAVFPEDADYSSYINPYNPRFVYKPAAFTFPSTAEQVAKVVQLAAKENLHVTARSGGHSYISNSLGGRDGRVVVDLRGMVDIQVDPVTHIAKVESGNRLGDVALGLNKAGRATPHGTCPDVGIGGHASYGGSGYTNRQWGLTLDSIESLDVVLGNGTLVHASLTDYPDLFWAMRGAGGSYGITTAFYLKTYPVPPSVTYFLYSYANLTTAQAVHALSAYQSFILSGPPSELGMILLVGVNRSGNIYASFVGGFYDDPSKFNATIQPMLAALPKVQQDGKSPNISVDVGSYIHSMELMGQFVGSPSLTNTTIPSYRTFTSSLMTPEKEPLSEKAVDALVNELVEQGSKLKLPSNCVVEAYGGPNSYVNTIPLNSTAFAHRDTLFTFECTLADPDATLKDHPEVGYGYVGGLIDAVVKSMPSGWDYGAYPNYIDDGLEDWQRKYYGIHYPKLQQIKKKYDPQEMFNFALGIELPLQ